MMTAAVVAVVLVVVVVSLSVWRQSCIDGSTLVVGSDDAGGRAKSVPGEGLRDEEVAEFAERQHRTAEYQAKSSANIAEQRERWVRHLTQSVLGTPVSQSRESAGYAISRSQSWVRLCRRVETALGTPPPPRCTSSSSPRKISAQKRVATVADPFGIGLRISTPLSKSGHAQVLSRSPTSKKCSFSWGSGLPPTW